MAEMALEAYTRWQKWLWKPKRDDSDGSGSLNEMAEMTLEANQKLTLKAKLENNSSGSQTKN